jgi:hypothetical protein
MVFFVDLLKSGKLSLDLNFLFFSFSKFLFMSEMAGLFALFYLFKSSLDFFLMVVEFLFFLLKMLDDI